MDDFLQTILAAPEDDSPRLVYADYLSERGDPRGELISLQIAMARGQVGVEASERVDELILACWHDVASVVAASGIQRFCVRRGFVEAVALDDKRLGELPVLMRAAPIVELKLTGGRDGALRLGAMRELLGVRTLDLRSLGMGDRRCVELMRSGFLANVSTLVLAGNGLGEAAATALVRAAPHLPCLEHLDLEANRLGDAGVSTVVGSRLLSQLVTLDVDTNDLSRETKRELRHARRRVRSGVGRALPTEGVWFPKVGSA